VPIDTLSFGPQTQDVSSGRLPNGTGPIVVLGFPSPGGNNEWMTAIDDESDLFKVYPNPFQDKVVFDMDTWGNRPALLQIFDLEGRIIASQPLNADSNSWKATGIASGMYVAKIAVKGLPDQFVKLVKN
jgi:hypothetical protein